MLTFLLKRNLRTRIRRELSLRIRSDPNNYYLESVPLPYRGLALHRIMEKTVQPLHEELPNENSQKTATKIVSKVGIGGLRLDTVTEKQTVRLNGGKFVTTKALESKN